MIRKGVKMIFKVGLTIVVLVAVYMYFALQDDAGDSDKKPYQNSKKQDAQDNTESQEGDVRLHASTNSGHGHEWWHDGIHLSVVVCGNRGPETIVLLKSAVIFTKTHIFFHIFTEDKLQEYFRNQLEHWPIKIKSRYTLLIYNISMPDGEDFNEWKTLFKLCASQRLFIPSILKTVDSLLYVDTDILFMQPLDDIWKFFKSFNGTHLVALAPEHEDGTAGWYNRFARHPYYGKLGVNSGVMLMNLTRLRKSSWLPSLIKYYKEYKLKITWGDQDLINIYFHYHPEELFVYSCRWNYRPDHCMYMSNCKDAEGDGVAVLHGNRRTFHSDSEPAFKSVYQAFLEFKLGDSVKGKLLEPLQQKLKNPANKECGKISHIFIKQIENFTKK